VPRTGNHRRFAVLAVLALFGGCGGGGGARTEAVALDEDPLRGVVPTVDGGTVDLATFAGEDLVVWFWAPW
jgi:hypothetical protein